MEDTINNVENLRGLFGIESKKEIREKAQRNYMIIGGVALAIILLMMRKR